ncbi:hypothetical protein AABC73_09085 [Pseudomonas sp. G.S.17]|uniref:hypothetical protein n=1 Tax=Pseudomonas sp. G.S.17 TaxID=3137451 RepID=UPI00311CB70A
MNTKQSRALAAPKLHNTNDPAGIGYMDTLDPNIPVLLRIGPYTGMLASDYIELFWGGLEEPIANYTVREEDTAEGTGSFVLLPVAQRYISVDLTIHTIVDAWYTVKRFVGGTVSESDRLPITIKLNIPGGIDIDPSTPYQNEALLKPSIFPAGIITSPDGVSVILMPYLNMEVGDKVTVSWNGEFVLHTIESEDQVGHPVVVPVPRTIIEMAGDSDMLEVRYEVRDIVNNWSRWSLPTFVEVEAGNSSLPAVITPQAPNSVLDLDRAAGNPVQALVLAYPQMAGSDEITLVVERNTAEGMALEPFVITKTVQNPSSFVEFFVPFEQFVPITQGRARLKYTVEKASGAMLRSKSLSLTVIGEVQELQAPKVPAAQDGVLDPASQNVVSLVPPYYFMADGNDVTLVWSGKTASGANVLHEELRTLSSDDVGKTLEYRIPQDKVSVLAGGTVQVYYTVNTFTRAFFKSPVLDLNVSQDTSVPLPAPSVDHVSADGVLDPANIGPEAIVRIQPYTGMAIRDKVSLHWEGRAPDGVYSTYTVLNSGTVDREVVFRVLKSIVVASLDARVNVWYEVERNGQIYRSARLAFVVQETVVTPLPVPQVKEAKGDTLYLADTANGATVVVQATANLKRNDWVRVDVKGANASDSKEKVVQEGDVGKELSLVFASAVISANVGQTIEVVYSVQRASGVVQTSPSLMLKVVGSLSNLSAPLMEGVGPAGILVPSKIPESGATVRVAYQDMQPTDSVIASWKGVSAHDTPPQVVGSAAQLEFNLPKALITATAGQPATVSYAATRASSTVVSTPLQLTVSPSLEFDASPVTLAGKIYLLPGAPDLLPAFPDGTTLQRVASGGQAPYVYSSSNPLVAVVDQTGLTSVRGRGEAIISVTDALGITASYTVTVTGVVHCIGLGNGTSNPIFIAAANAGARIPSIEELREIFNAYGSRWPMGNNTYWSSSITSQSLLGTWYWVKNLVLGQEVQTKHSQYSNGVGLR